MSFSGSDFTRNLQYKGDIVFNRFLTISGRIEDNWTEIAELPTMFPDRLADGSIPPFIDTVILVEKDTADVGKDDPNTPADEAQTVQTVDD